MNRQTYEEARMEIILLSVTDVITSSNDEIPIGGEQGDD